MIQKCPNCGKWCETDGANMLSRFGQGWLTSVNNVSDGASGFLGEKVGAFLGGAIGSYTGLIRGAFNSVFGYKYQFTCQNCGTEWGTDDPAEDQTKDFIKEQNDQKKLYERICKAEENNNTTQAIQLLNDFLTKFPGCELEYVYKELAYLYSVAGENEKTMATCEAGFNALGEDATPSAYRYLFYYQYLAEANLGRLWAARKDALLVARFSEDEMLNTPDGEIKLKDLASRDFADYNDYYRQHFLEIPYKDRKMLMIVDQYTDLDQAHLDVFQLRDAPEGVVFPVGHPVSNQLYVGHPFIPEMYVPFETYQLVFIEDKVREFCEIAQCLGATEIIIEALNSSLFNGKSNTDTTASGSADYSGVSGNASSHNKSRRSLIDEISKSMSFHQVYSPYMPAHLPEKTVWYQNEPSWQRLYKQRIAGSLLEHEERIETRKSQVAEGNELNEIKGEFKTLFVEGNGEWSRSIEESFSQQENAILAIHIKFLPLGELKGEMATAVSAPHYSKGEQEYINELICTLEDGEIGPRERKALDRARVRLGISEARAAEIEASVSTPKLTNEENEYLAEVKAVLEDGEIGTRERKSLERVRVRLGISEERAKEIEHLC